MYPGLRLGVLLLVPFVLLLRWPGLLAALSLPSAGVAISILRSRMRPFDSVSGWVSVGTFTVVVGFVLVVLVRRCPTVLRRRSWTWLGALMVASLASRAFGSVSVGITCFVMILSLALFGVLGGARIDPRASLVALGQLLFYAVSQALLLVTSDVVNNQSFSYPAAMRWQLLGTLTVVGVATMIVVRHSRQVLPNRR